MLASYVLVHLTQHTIGRHFHFGEETHSVSELVSVSALVGLLMHTFVDGVAVASGLRVSQALGALVFVAVLLHKFPEGLAISSLFLAAGARRRAAILAAAALGATTIAGVVLTDHSPFLRTYGLAISAGVTLYVGASNLVPEFQDRPGRANSAELRRRLRAVLRRAYARVDLTAAAARGDRSPATRTSRRALERGTGSLFERTCPQPLAARMRPRTLDEFVGQRHLLAPGKPLREAIEKGTVGSMVFWGPPGIGQDDDRSRDRAATPIASSSRSPR